MEKIKRNIIESKIKDFLEEKEEGSDDSNEEGEDEEKVSSQYKKVQDILKNDIFNHSAIIERLWGEKDATNRSLFRKKLHRVKEDDGTYEFDDKELSKIMSILRSAANEVGTGNKKKKPK